MVDQETDNQNSLCYICLENHKDGDEFVQSNCKCKNMKIHNECFLGLNDKNRCSVCKDKYQDFIVKFNNKIIKFRKHSITEHYSVNSSNRIEGLYMLKLYNYQIIVHCFYKDGIKNGFYQTFYINGKIEEFGYYVNGNKHGCHQKLYKNGNIKSITEYKNGIPHGFHIHYDENGNHIIKTSFYENKLNGKFKLYHPNGKKWISIRYKMDLIKENYKEWNELGTLIKSNKKYLLDKYIVDNFQFIRLFLFIIFIYIF